MPSQITQDISSLPSVSNGVARLSNLLQHSESLTWIFTGDAGLCSTSTSSGTFPRKVADWVKSQLRRVDDIFVNATYTNLSMSKLRGRMQERFAGFEPDVVTVMCGFNDLNRDAAECQAFEDELINVIHVIQTLGAIPVICTPPCSGAESDDQLSIDQLVHIEAIRGCTREHSAILIDHWELWENRRQQQDLWNSETRQPTSIGVGEMAKQYIKTLGMHRLIQPSAPVQERQ